jgi:hypothetical protein
MNRDSDIERKVSLVEQYVRAEVREMGWSYLRTEWYREYVTLVLSKPSRLGRVPHAFPVSDAELANEESRLLQIVHDKWVRVRDAHKETTDVRPRPVRPSHPLPSVRPFRRDSNGGRRRRPRRACESLKGID